LSDAAISQYSREFLQLFQELVITHILDENDKFSPMKLLDTRTLFKNWSTFRQSANSKLLSSHWAASNSVRQRLVLLSFALASLVSPFSEKHYLYHYQL